MLDEKSLIAYRKRWQAVAAIEETERQASSTTDRWRQLNALLLMAQTLEILPPDDDFGQDEGRQRWQILYETTYNKTP